MSGDFWVLDLELRLKKDYLQKQQGNLKNPEVKAKEPIRLEISRTKKEIKEIEAEIERMFDE